MTTDRDTGGRRALTLLTWCASAGLGLLFMKVDTMFDFVAMTSYRPQQPTTTAYLGLAATAGALVAWHLAPRRSWAWLLLAGAVCAVVEPLLWLMVDRTRVPLVLSESLAVFTVAAPSFTVVGVVGAATLVWRAGREGTGAALLGAAVVLQLLGPVVMGSLSSLPGYLDPTTFTVFLVVAGIACLGGLVAVVTRPAAESAGGRPDRRTTAGASVAAACPLLVLVWQPDPASPSSARNYFLFAGLTFLAIGVAIGAVGGPRVLLAAASAGLLLGPFGMLIQPAVEVLRDMPVLAVVAAAGSVLLGCAAALSRWRDRIGIACLAVVFVGLIVVFGLFNSDSPRSSYLTVSEVLTPILLVVSVVGAVTCVGAIGGVLAARAESPAVFVGAATPFSLGAIAVIAHFALHHPPGKAPLVGLLPPTAGALLLSALCLALLVARHRRQRLTGARDSRGAGTPSWAPSTGSPEPSNSASTAR